MKITTHPIIQIGYTESRFSGAAAELRQLRRQFEQQHCALLPELLEPGLLRFVQEQLAGGGFSERVHEGINSNKELCLCDNRTLALLHVLLNNRELRRLVEQVTGCGCIGSFQGRVYRVIPGQGHHDAWHNDLGEQRLLALSLNLSAEPYQGGVLQIRERASQRIVYEIANIGCGDAIVFRLDKKLQHRITEVEGVWHKTAFAGWFRAGPDYLATLRGASLFTGV